MTHRRAVLIVGVALAGLTLQAHGPSPQRTDSVPAFTVPDGFTVEQVYDAARSGSVLALAFDVQRRLVFAREKGPVVRLLDRNGDGRIDAEQIVTDQVTNCQGLEFDGTTLLAVGEGPQGPGLYRVPDANGDGVGDGVELVALASDPLQEHGPHDVFFGPDGWLYWIFGNFSTVAATPDPESPHRAYYEEQILPAYTDPRSHPLALAPGGSVYRRDIRREGSDWQLVAGGMRNAYDAEFNAEGELLTFDSDMEWDLGLPWYRPVRTDHLVPGGEYGWRNGSGMWPEYYADILPPMTNIGRGSPTGVTVYLHNRFPKEYHGAVFNADWSRGRILAGFLEPSGATYRERSVEFLAGTPLNVTDIEVGPDGALYFGKGGRQTEGGIYRVVYTRASDAVEPAVLDQPQPRSAWARAAIAKQKDAMGTSWAPTLEKTIADVNASPGHRVRALELREVYGPALDEPRLASLLTDRTARVRSAAVYYLGMRATDSARRAIAGALGDDDPFVRRRACEALIRTGITPGEPAPFDPVATVLPLLGDENRFVRYAARLVLERVNRNRWSAAALGLTEPTAAAQGLIALARTAGRAPDTRAVLQRVQALVETGPDGTGLLPLLRALHLAMARSAGVNYSAIYSAIGDRLLARFPGGDLSLDRELARTLAAMHVGAAVPKIVAQLTAPGTDREQQIFFVYALRALGGEWRSEDRQAVLDWFRRADADRWKGGASFPGYLRRLWADYLDLLPEADQARARAAVPGFEEGGTPGQPVRIPDMAAYSDQELREYLQFDPMAYSGDPEKGRAIYEKAFCVNCHRHGEVGQEAGPDLTDVGRRFKRSDLLDAILTPSKTISDQWAAVEITMRNKQALAGVITDETPDAVQLLTITGQRVRVPKADIQSRVAAKASPMPEGLLNALSLKEVSDLFAFLERGGGSGQ